MINAKWQIPFTILWIKYFYRQRNLNHFRLALYPYNGLVIMLQNLYDAQYSKSKYLSSLGYGMHGFMGPFYRWILFHIECRLSDCGLLLVECRNIPGTFVFTWLKIWKFDQNIFMWPCDIQDWLLPSEHFCVGRVIYVFCGNILFALFIILRKILLEQKWVYEAFTD